MSPNTPPWRVALDTNVVLDLLHFANASVLPILHAIENHRARCYASQNTLAELRRVLTYPEFDLDASAQTALLTRYQSWCGEAHVVRATPQKLPRCSDPDDQMFLELAAAVPADFLISKDKALLAMKRKVRGFKILSPGEAAAFFAPYLPPVISAASSIQIPPAPQQIP